LTRTYFIIVGAGTMLALSGLARAQEASVTEVVSDDGNSDAGALATREGNGYSVGRGLQLHSSVELDGGATDNVFYESPNATPVGSGLMRVRGTLDLATDRVKLEDLGDADSGPAEDGDSRSYTFRAGLGATYEEYLSSNSSVRAQRNLTLHANADLTVAPRGPFTVILRDRFIRDVRSPNFEDSLTLDRDDNRAYIGVRASSGVASATLHFENWLSVFENGQASQFANRVNDLVGLLGEWQLLPFTKVSADVSYGFYGPLGTSMISGMRIKTSSQPVRAVVGLSSLLTSQTSLKVHVGYAHASYDIGTGYSAPVGGAEFGYRWSPTGRIVAIYDYDHFDSFSANFYADHLFAARVIQQLGPVVFDGGPEVRLRHFGGVPALFGPPSRDDRVVAGSARVQLLVAEKYSLSGEYRLAIVGTDYRATTFDAMGNAIGMYDPGFVRNEFWLGFRAAY
jgi:hypothetical protein